MRHETFERAGPFGDTIRGDARWWGDEPPSTAVVIAHGFKGFRDWGFFPHLAEELARAGHLTVTFDFSLNGTSPGAPDLVDPEAFARNTFTRELEELRWVIRKTGEGELGPGPPGAVGVLGHSRGGGIAVLAAREDPAIRSLVTWAAVATFDRWNEPTKTRWRESGRTHTRNARTGRDLPLDRTLLEDLERNAPRLDVEAGAREVDRPWLVVHGTEDESVPLGEGEALARAAPAARLAAVEGAGHTFGASHPLEGVPPHLECAVQATLEHFARTLFDADPVGEGAGGAREAGGAERRGG